MSNRIVDMGDFRRSLDARYAAEEDKLQREIALLEKKMRQEIEKARNEYELERKRREEIYNQRIRGVPEVYCQPIAEKVLKTLKGDYELMRSRSPILDISDKDIERAIKHKESLNEMKDDNSRRILLETITSYDSSIKGIIEIISGNFQERRNINSFTAVFSGGVYLISPVANNPDNKLTKNLESKIHDVVSHGSVDTRNLRDSVYNNSPTDGKLTEFTADFQILNGFLVYLLKPKRGTDFINLEKGIARKLCDKNIQPEGFKQANLKHDVYIIPPEVIDFLPGYTS